MKKVAVILSDGFEELEAVTVIDILRRAGIEVEIIGLRNTQLTGSRGVTIICDDIYDYYSCLEYDGVIMVGGMDNATNLSQDDSVLNLLRDYMSKNKLIAGICATPALVFPEAGILEGKVATCYPSDSLINNLDCEFLDKECVVCGNLITSQSPDTAMEFALTIVQYLGYDASSVYADLQGKR
ncbi:MAG: DJ-1 family glyoxalase III [Christensenellales bacterium]